MGKKKPKKMGKKKPKKMGKKTNFFTHFKNKKTQMGHRKNSAKDL